MVSATANRLNVAAPTRESDDPSTHTDFLVMDTESIPDGRLIQRVKYPDCPEMTPEEAVARAQAEELEASGGKKDFIPVTFQIPVSVCIARVSGDLKLLNVACLDAPQFRPRDIAAKFWSGLRHQSLSRAKIVTFNGRGFDLPLLELAAFRHALPISEYLQKSRNRYSGNTLDLMEWVSNYNAFRVCGGLNLLAKMLGLPGKMGVSGGAVYPMYLEGRLQEINDYCLCDTLDTYFIFLRSRVLTGDISPDQEMDCLEHARDFLEVKAREVPAVRAYLQQWRGAP